MRLFSSVRRHIEAIRSAKQHVRVAREKLSENDYDFYRCYSCMRLITRPEEILCFLPGSPTAGRICPCGSLRYRPSWPRWYEWLLPRVLYFRFLRFYNVA